MSSSTPYFVQLLEFNLKSLTLPFQKISKLICISSWNIFKLSRQIDERFISFDSARRKLEKFIYAFIHLVLIPQGLIHLCFYSVGLIGVNGVNLNYLIYFVDWWTPCFTVLLFYERSLLNTNWASTTNLLNCKAWTWLGDENLENLFNQMNEGNWVVVVPLHSSSR